MTTWLEFYYCGVPPLISSSRLDSSVLSIGLVESSNDPLEPPSGEPITINELEQALDCYRTLQSISPDWREWVERASEALVTLEQMRENPHVLQALKDYLHRNDEDNGQ